MFAYCNNNSVNHTDSIGYDYVESIDTDGDGIPDCDVYSYSYECNIVIQISYNYSFSVSGEGKIYFLRNVHDPKQLDDPSNWPNGYDPSSDYLCIDSLNYKQNPNIHLHNSYMCSIEAKMLAITTEIEAYGKLQQNPELGWGREAREMVDEWKYHNWLAVSDEAKHVDFDRYEKNRNFIYFLNKGFKRVQWKVTYWLARLLFE